MAELVILALGVDFHGHWQGWSLALPGTTFLAATKMES